MKDLVVVAADKDMQKTVEGLLTRPKALGIRELEVDLYTHPQHDPACALHGVEFMSDYSQQYRYGLLMFDHEGSGKEDTQPFELQEAINEDFSRSSWGKRGRALVLAPELEAWVWSKSPHVSRIAGWGSDNHQLRSWLIRKKYLERGETKPASPKKAFEAALQKSRTPRSSSLYLQLAMKVSLKQCSDAGFLEFRKILRQWFPPL